MTFADIVFLLMVLMTAAGALATVLSRSIIYATLGLVLTMFGIAGLYVYLESPFLAMMQILIYVGAVTILIAFAVMLAGPMYKNPKEWSRPVAFAASLLVALVSSFFMYRGLASGGLAAVGEGFTHSTQAIGRALFDRFMLPFELISLLIVVAIIGSIMLALLAKEEK